MLISKRINQTTDLNFKAPKNEIYMIRSITIIPVTIAANRVLVFDRHTEEEPASISESVDTIFFANMALSVITQIYYEEPVITKFIGINAVNESTPFDARIIINYSTRRATKTELIIEWFRKGR